MNRRSTYARRSKLLGRQQRQEALRAAHLESIRKSQGELNELNYHLPQPGPMTEGASKRKRFKDLAEARTYLKDVANGKVPKGLKALAALDFLDKSRENG